MSAAFALSLCRPAGAEERREERVHRPRVVIKMRRVAVPAPRPIVHEEHIVRDEHRVEYPRRDERGVAIVKTAALVPPAHHATIMGNAAFLTAALGLAAVETARNHYYWHTDHGVKFCHYDDAHGNHWYGFYHGKTFYWTRYNAGRWWWHDDRFGRWVYWSDGYWWWQGPNGHSYVYVQNNYYPYENGAVVVQNPELQPPATTNPAPNEGKTYPSPDGTRLVQIYGPRSEAFLYAQSPTGPAFLKYLGENVAVAKFSASGGQTEVLLNFKDGSFAVYDSNGAALEAPSSTASLPPPSPDAPAPAPAPADASAPPDAPPSGDAPPAAPPGQ